jgi:hypothetical protein
MLSASPVDDISIANPCPASWDRMTGDDRVRYCGLCRLNVYNLSSMTRDEADALIRQKEGRLCVRFYRRADGTVLTRACPQALTKLRRTFDRFAARLAALALLLLGILVTAPTPQRQRDTTPLREIEPIKTVIDWFSPAPRRVMGAPVPSTPVCQGKPAFKN